MGRYIYSVLLGVFGVGLFFPGPIQHVSVLALVLSLLLEIFVAVTSVMALRLNWEDVITVLSEETPSRGVFEVKAWAIGVVSAIATFYLNPYIAIAYLLIHVVCATAQYASHDMAVSRCHKE